MQITKAQHEAMKRGEYQLLDPPALPPAQPMEMEVVDAEVVPDAQDPAESDIPNADTSYDCWRCGEYRNVKPKVAAAKS